MKKLWKKYKEIVLYLIFGGGTTLVNIVVYYACAHLLQQNTVISTGIAWLLSVLFAYVTNKIWVFESKTHTMSEVLREVISFFSCRLLTGLLDIAIMFVCVDVLKWNDLIVKILSNVIVIVLNYVASKLIIFARKDKE